MAGSNRGVVYTGPGSVEVHDLDYPKLELPEQSNRPLQHGVILKVVATNICGSDQHMVRGDHRPRGPDPRPRDHRRGRRGRPRRRVPQGRRPGQRPVQHRLRALPQLQGAQHRRLRERQPGQGRRRLRLCRHGRLARRPGRVRDRPLRRLQPAQVPRPRPGHGEDPGPGHAVGHLPDRLPRRLDRRGDHRLDRLHRRRRPGRAGQRHLRPPAGRGRGHRRRHAEGPPGPGGQLRLRDDRPVGPRRPARAAPADPGRRGRGRRRRRLRRLRGPRPRHRGLPGRGSRDRAELGDGHHQVGRAARDPRAVCDRRPGRRRRAGQGRVAVDPDRARLGQVPRPSPPASAR